MIQANVQNRNRLIAIENKLWGAKGKRDGGNKEFVISRYKLLCRK